MFGGAPLLHPAARKEVIEIPHTYEPYYMPVVETYCNCIDRPYENKYEKPGGRGRGRHGTLNVSMRGAVASCKNKQTENIVWVF